MISFRFSCFALLLSYSFSFDSDNFWITILFLLCLLAFMVWPTCCAYTLLHCVVSRAYIVILSLCFCKCFSLFCNICFSSAFLLFGALLSFSCDRECSIWTLRSGRLDRCCSAPHWLGVLFSYIRLTRSFPSVLFIFAKPLKLRLYCSLFQCDLHSKWYSSSVVFLPAISFILYNVLAVMFLCWNASLSFSAFS